MLTIARCAASGLLVLLTATMATAPLTTKAYARGGGHSGSHGSPHSLVHKSVVKSRATVVSKHRGKTVPKGQASLRGRRPHPKPVVRDHRGDPIEGAIPNNISICSNGCVNEGGLIGAHPAPQQTKNSTSWGGNAHDHRN